jgi:hypothetical protein
MAQENLLYRRQAELAESAEERAALLKMALIDTNRGTKQKRATPEK